MANGDFLKLGETGSPSLPNNTATNETKLFRDGTTAASNTVFIVRKASPKQPVPGTAGVSLVQRTRQRAWRL